MRQLWMTLALSSMTFAGAANLQEATALLNKGDWTGAVTMAQGIGGSEGYTLAAQATTLGASISPDSSKQAMFERAQGYAKQAVSANPQNAAAHFELARANGRLAQYVGILQSLSLAGDIKKELDTAIRLNPNLASAYVALGLWNAELASKGFVATTATGASINNVAPNFGKAFSLEPNNVTHRLEYANALLKLDRNRNKAGAITQLSRAVTLTPGTFWEQQDLAAARKLLASLK